MSKKRIIFLEGLKPTEEGQISIEQMQKLMIVYQNKFEYYLSVIDNSKEDYSKLLGKKKTFIGECIQIENKVGTAYDRDYFSMQEEYDEFFSYYDKKYNLGSSIKLKIEVSRN